MAQPFFFPTNKSVISEPHGDLMHWSLSCAFTSNISVYEEGSTAPYYSHTSLGQPPAPQGCIICIIDCFTSYGTGSFFQKSPFLRKAFKNYLQKTYGIFRMQGGGGGVWRGHFPYVFSWVTIFFYLLMPPHCNLCVHFNYFTL